MRVAFLSPLPPAKSGIADYSQELLGELRPLAEIAVFNSEATFDAARFDVAIYQIGNNADHAFAYRTALRQPGIVVLHEANLHHLIAEMTIRAGDWDAYLAEIEYEGGSAALPHARRVRALEVGPDYEGVPMLRRILEKARGLIVHSEFVADCARQAGYAGPVARIPHGAFIPQVDRMAVRERLGVPHSFPLIGVFGHLKPYKRIPESLRALKRLLRLRPDARMILAGEPHPDLPLDGFLRDPILAPAVRVLGRLPLEQFVANIAACDIVLNLRFPTVGETSGTLLRALGLGRAVIVSDVGAFREFPEDTCLRVPVGGQEEALLFEYLNLLVSRPDLARAMGERARQFVARECTWARTARQYVDFAEAIVAGRSWQPPSEPAPAPAPQPVSAAYISSWAAEADGAGYVHTHLSRLQRTLAITPAGAPADRILEMGAYLQITPALRSKLGYGEVRGCYLGPAGGTDHKRIVSEDGEVFECDLDLFDAERDPFPYPDAHFATVLCCELIEHLAADPMHMMAEINRILRPGGHLVLTTPNIASARALAAILQGYHPGFFPAYLCPSEAGPSAEARHNREYSPREIHMLLHYAGFEVTLLETGEFRDVAHPEHHWVFHLLQAYNLETGLRGDGIYAVGRKCSPVRERYPGFLYS